MDDEKSFPSQSQHALLTELSWYRRWGRRAVWLCSIAAGLVVFYLCLHMFTPLLRTHTPGSVEASLQELPNIDTDGLFRAHGAVPSSLPGLPADVVDSRVMTTSSAILSEASNSRPESTSKPQRQDDDFVDNAASSVSTDVAERSDLVRRIDAVKWNRRYAIAALPFSAVAFSVGVWGLAQNCISWKSDKETGQKVEGEKDGSQCIINSITSFIGICGTIGAAVPFYANVKGLFNIYIGNPPDKRDDHYSSGVNRTGIQELSDAIGHPLSYIGEHHYHWPLGDPLSNEPTHHSSVLSLDHPTGAIHFAVLGHSDEGHPIYKMGFGSGKSPKQSNSSSAAERRNVDRYNYFENQAFTGDASIYLKGISNPDGSQLDNPSRLNFNALWDDFYQQIACYLQVVGMGDPSGMQFQVYDDVSDGTAFAGALAFFNGPSTGDITKLVVGSGLQTNDYCVNYNS